MNRRGGQNGVEARRTGYIIGELAEHNILTGEGESSIIQATLIEHLKHALFETKHEGVEAGYGAILTEYAWDEYDPEDAIFGGIKEINHGATTNRMMADGLSSFVWSRPLNQGSGRHETLISFKAARFVDELLTYHLRLDARTKKDSEGSFAGFHSKNDFVVLQHYDRRTRVLGDTGVLYIDGNHWSVRPYAYELGLSDIVQNAWPELDAEDLNAWGETAERVATIALHVLSAASIGTTIVLLKKPFAECGDGTNPIESTLDLAEGFSFELPDDEDGLRLTSRPCIRPFESLARQLDGAFVVDPDGTVRHAKVWLNLGTPDDAEPIKSSLGGSRQRSAENASRLIPGIVLTVSSDGPVRAFAHGQLAASTVLWEQENLATGGTRPGSLQD